MEQKKIEAIETIAKDKKQEFKEKKEKIFPIPKNKPRKVLFKNYQSPGDVVMMTAAVRDLKLSHPEFEIGVDTSCKEIWEYNPNIVPFGSMKKKDPGVEFFKAEYPLIHNSNECQYHFIHGFRQWMEDILDVKIKATKFKGDMHISKDEKGWMSQVEEMGIKDRFWIMMAGGKFDFTAKWWVPEYYQEVVDHFKGKITFVQCGEEGHWHPPLKNVVSLIGKTNLRQFIRLIYHSVGVVSPVTFAMHAAEAIEFKHGHMHRPAVILAGGREPSQWEKYPHHRFIETNGALSCCDNGGCWKSRCSKVGDGDSKDGEGELCLHPIGISTGNDTTTDIAKCMYMIKPCDVIRSIESYYEGGVLKYGSSINGGK